MRFYDSFETAPLKFHNVYYKILCPILSVLQVILFIATIGHLTSDKGYYSQGALLYDLFYYLVSIPILCLTTYGFAKKKAYAWYMVYAYLILRIINGIVGAALQYNAAIAVGSLIGSLVIPILVGVYYYKRKLVFVSQEGGSFGVATTTVEPRAVSHHHEGAPEISYCRKCGNRIAKDSLFCNKCGSKIDWN